MLHNNITNFLQYCKNSNFSELSIETLSLRLHEFNLFIQEQLINSIKKINYQHLLQFDNDYKTPSPSIKKARVWSLHQFFHYLKLQQLIPHNIAAKMAYPKIEKKIVVLCKGNKRRSMHLDNEMTAILTQWIAVRKQFLNYDISNALFIPKKVFLNLKV